MDNRDIPSGTDARVETPAKTSGSIRSRFHFRNDEWSVSISPADGWGYQAIGFDKVATLVTNDVTRCYCPFNHLPWDDEKTIMALGVRAGLHALGFIGFTEAIEEARMNVGGEA